MTLSLFGGAIIGIPVLMLGLVGGVLTGNDFEKYKAAKGENASEIILIRDKSIFDNTN